MPDNTYTVDIVIPSYRPGEKFRRLFEMLGKQTVKYDHLIIINTGKELMDKNIRDMLNAEPRTLLTDIEPADFDHAATRMAGVRMSHADVFVCMTDDAVPYDEHLIERLTAALKDNEDAAVAYARQLAAEDADESEKYVRIFNYPDVPARKTIKDINRLGIKTFFASNVCCAYRRDIFDSLGGFTESAIFNEDMIYAASALKAGYASVYAADAKVIHSHNYTAMQQFHRNFDLGISQSMHPEVFSGLKSEGEGIRLVKKTVAHLLSKGCFTEIPVFITRTGFRYLGFRLGRSYDRLSDRQIVSFSMNKNTARRIAASRHAKENKA